MRAGQGGSSSVMGRCRLDQRLPWDTATPSMWRGGDTRKLAVCRGTSPSAVRLCGTGRGSRRAFSWRRWGLLSPYSGRRPLQKPEGLLLTKAGGLLINKWEIMVLITRRLVLIELS